MAPVFAGEAASVAAAGLSTNTLYPRRSKWRSAHGLSGRQVADIAIGAISFGAVLIILLIFALRKGWIKGLHLLGKKTPTEKKVAQKEERKEVFLEGKRVERRVYKEKIGEGKGVEQAEREARIAREMVS